MNDARLSTPRLARLARTAAGERDGAPRRDAREEPEERCELCSELLPERHRHLVDVETAALLCACQACSTLMDHQAAGGGHYRIVPRDTRRIVDLELPEGRWHALGVPVELVFFVDREPREGVIAFFPGALGAAEARPDPAAWETLREENPVVAELAADVEALLVRRVDGVRHAYAAPLDACYRLTGLIRSRWRGLSGGTEVWEAVGDFFAELDGEALPVDRRGRRVEAPLPLRSSDPQEMTT